MKLNAEDGFELIGVTTVEVAGGRLYMAGVHEDKQGHRKYEHTYMPAGKKREVSCLHLSAEDCYAHDVKLGMFGQQPSKDVQEFIDWAVKNGFRPSDLGKRND